MFPLFLFSDGVFFHLFVLVFSISRCKSIPNRNSQSLILFISLLVNKILSNIILTPIRINTSIAAFFIFSCYLFLPFPKQSFIYLIFMVDFCLFFCCFGLYLNKVTPVISSDNIKIINVFPNIW